MLYDIIQDSFQDDVPSEHVPVRHLRAFAEIFLEGKFMPQCLSMLKPSRTIAALVASSLLLAHSANAEVELDGQNATPELIARIAQGETVRVAASARQRVRQAHNVLIAAASGGQKIYGLTVGVGLNKDRDMVDAKGHLTK